MCVHSRTKVDVVIILFCTSGFHSEANNSKHLSYFYAGLKRTGVYITLDHGPREISKKNFLFFSIALSHSLWCNIWFF